MIAPRAHNEAGIEHITKLIDLAYKYVTTGKEFLAKCDEHEVDIVDGYRAARIRKEHAINKIDVLLEGLTERDGQLPAVFEKLCCRLQKTLFELVYEQNHDRTFNIKKCAEEFRYDYAGLHSPQSRFVHIAQAGHLEACKQIATLADMQPSRLSAHDINMLLQQSDTMRKMVQQQGVLKS